jgi:hypothetical protein
VGRDEGADFLGMWRDNLLFGQHTDTCLDLLL